MGRSRVRKRWYLDSNGPLGIGMLVGVAAGGIAWWPAAVAAGAAWLGMVVVEVVRSSNAVEHLCKVFSLRSTGGNWPHGKHTGELRGLTIEVEDGAHEVSCGVALFASCATLRLAKGTGTIGDPEFDKRFEVGGSAWRFAFPAVVRRRILDSFSNIPLAIGDGVAAFVINDENAAGPAIEALIRELVDLAHDLDARITGGPAALLAGIASEPAAVRRGHYTWMVETGFEVPAVLRHAAKDPDPEIVAWARAQQPPSDDVYR